MSIYKGNNLISGHQVLYSMTGQNTDGAMTQKAVSNITENTRFDGQWVSKYVLLQNVSKAGTYQLSLADYLPQDGYNYEILIDVSVVNNVDVSNTYIKISSDIIQKSYIMAGSDNTLGGVVQHNGAVIPAKSYITSSIEGSVSFARVELCGYRRIGTNT